MDDSLSQELCSESHEIELASLTTVKAYQCSIQNTDWVQVFARNHTLKSLLLENSQGRMSGGSLPDFGGFLLDNGDSRLEELDFHADSG